MVLSIIVAAAKNGVIGKEGGLPWYLPAELAFFKSTTMGHPIIMGRKTHESIGRTLPGRENIVITRDNGYKAAEGTKVVNSLNEALELVKSANEAFIIGGEQIYAQSVPLAQRIYMTHVDVEIDGDKFFKFEPEQWRLLFSEKHSADEKNKYDFEFTTWGRIKELT